MHAEYSVGEFQAAKQNDLELKVSSASHSQLFLLPRECDRETKGNLYSSLIRCSCETVIDEASKNNQKYSGRIYSFISSHEGNKLFSINENYIVHQFEKQERHL